ncbi:hypothetical protein XG19_004650 [Salmonella enterica subsp. enterica serovar Gaminara]|nr:hypothetical protein [Salmonella enterica subsp. enterica serovar Gaminara]ECO0313581.1 hypothetical protein [Salmonella enterica subsp. enterica serovar Schwarzengrund]EDP8789993.1 hypothetical protein [Salmonella enterica subsp. enterica]ECY4705420.1 hypothetical protein [Salmonella enterica subsp. enterica serovar Gaminara]ECY5825947.1 hypothetical protein [Salmonella enterica subsp. enterica serovar Schwarzengrund]
MHRLCISICQASAYVTHTHILTICICNTYTRRTNRHILHPCGNTPWHTQHRRKNHAHSFDI